MMSMENPVVSAPEGELITGVAVDIPDEGGSKGKDMKENEEADEGKAAAAK